MQGIQVLGLIAAILYLLIVISPFFLLFLIFSKQNKWKHDKILIAWLCVNSINSVFEILKIAELLHNLAFLADISKVFFMSNIFFFQAYGRSVLDQEFKWKKNILITFTPLVLWLGTYFFALYEKDDWKEVFLSKPITSGEIPLPFQLLDAIVAVGIAVLCITMLIEIRNLKRFNNKIILKNQLDNFRKLIGSVGAIYLVIAIWEYLIPKSLKNETFNIIGGAVILFFIAIGVILVCFFSFKQMHIYKKRSPLIASNEVIMQVNKKIKQIMATDKPYLDPEFSVSKLAVLLGEPPPKISEAIKINHSGNFLSYINQYRVKEAKNMIKDPGFKNYSLVAIGLESGFNSKATFNRVFKNEAGMTPSAYRLRVNSQ
ncbi:MAG: helix-turn-helix domain-containing protein [Bacteroidota bacterium]